MTSYGTIFKQILNHISDPGLVNWPEEDLLNELYGWLKTAIAKLPQLQDVTSDRDEFDINNVDNCGFHNTLSDTIQEVLALSATREWLRPQINSTTLTLQSFAKSEGYSQREFLRGLMELDESIELELKKLLRDTTYTNNEYFD
jgi:hypothetical protein